MWLLQGRFAEESREELSKVLKYGQTYTLGRKIPADIVVDSKFVSRVSCHITVVTSDTVASHISNATDPLAFHNDLNLRPRVTIRFEANKSRNTFAVLQRRSQAEPKEIQVPANTEHTLEDGDSFALTTTISLKLVWKPVAVCFAAKIKEAAIAPLRPIAAQLGIHLSPAKSRWRDGYTHLCLIQVKPTESVLCALLQAKPIVTIDYFQELFRRSSLPRHDNSSLETSYPTLDPSLYQPSIDQQELSDLPNLPTLLLPNEDRLYMLKGTTCVFFTTPNEDAELSIYKSILSVAGARVFTHNPVAEGLRTKADFAQLLMPYKNSALSYWRNSGSRARALAPDEGLVVLVGAVHDGEGWKKGCEVACGRLRVAMPAGFHAVTNAIFAADVRGFLNVLPNVSDGEGVEGEGQVGEAQVAPVTTTQQEAAADVTAVEQDVQPPTPAVESAPREEAVEASMPPPAAVQPPTSTSEPSNTAGEPARKPLTRRTRKPAPDAAEDLDAPLVPETADVRISNDKTGTEAAGSAEPTTSSQLTRSERVGLTRRTGTSRTTGRRSDIFDAILQPEGAASVGDGSASISGDLNASIGSSFPKSRRFRMDLDEEDRIQESQSQARTEEAESGGHKRKTPPPPTASDAEQSAATEPSKRLRTAARTHEASPVATEPARIEPSLNPSGLSPNAPPDSEPGFLQALSTQRAKGKKMDAFDVDFNRLHIAKPATSQPQIKSKEGGRVDDDYEAFKKLAEEELRIHVRGNFVQVDFVPLVRAKPVQPRRETEGGRLNFKKFRPKGSVPAGKGREGVAMVLPESHDYGLGGSYWDDQEQGSSLRGKKRATQEEAAPRLSRTPVALEAEEGAAVNLELDSMDSDDGGMGDISTLLKRQNNAKGRAAPRKRPAPATVAGEGESDEDMPPPPSTKKRLPAKAAMVFDDEDEDEESDEAGGDGNFAGFGRSTSTRRRRGGDGPAASGGSRGRRRVF